MTRKKHSSRELLDALEGGVTPPGGETLELYGLGRRMEDLASTLPVLDELRKKRIWEKIDLSGRREEAVTPAAKRPRVPSWMLGTAAALVLVTVGLVLFFSLSGKEARVVEAEKVAVFEEVRGEITVVDSSGTERRAAPGDEIEEGATIVCAEGARGVVEFKHGSQLRIEGGSEVLLAVEGENVAADVIRGRTYHRVMSGEKYLVRSGAMRVYALGTAFSLDVEEGLKKLRTLHSHVKIEIRPGESRVWTSELEEGKVFLYREGEGEGYVSELGLSDLDEEWFRWNKELDEKLGLPLGALALLDAAPEGGESESQPEVPVPSPPAEEGGDEGGQVAPSPGPPPPPPPPKEMKVDLSAEVTGKGVEFSWNVIGYSGFQGYKLCRSETDPQPSYPGDWCKYIDGEETRYALDDSVEAGHTYYYRLAVYDHGDIFGYSNAVRVTVPGQPRELSVVLSAEARDGVVELSWEVSGEGAYSGFKLCRSETDPQPSYPGDWCKFLQYGTFSYRDTEVKPGGTYYYRVGIYKDGAVVVYSNSVKVTLP